MTTATPATTPKTYTNKEIRANRKRWLAALESGAFVKGNTVFLNSHTGAYCVLGVGAAIMGFPITSADEPYDKVGAAFGLYDYAAVYRLNDYCKKQLSFQQIARKLRTGKYWRKLGK